MAIISDSVPTGTIFAYAGSTAPSGYLLCNGSLVSRTTYAALFSAIKTTHGYGDGSTTFALPNLQNRFVRGKDFNAGIDPDSSSRTAVVSGTFTVSGTWGSKVGYIECDTTNIGIGMSCSGTPISGTGYVSKVSSTNFFWVYADNSIGITPALAGSGTITLSKSALGDNIGSFQADSTAAPTTTDFRTTDSGTHQHRILLYADDFMVTGTGLNVSDNDSSGYTTTSYWTTDSGDGGHTHTITGGGDSETAPISLCLNYIIKT